MKHRGNKLGKAYYTFTKSLDWIHNRLKEVKICNEDALNILARYDSKDTFFYLDPPYVMEVRETTKLYDYEVDNQHYIELVERLLSLKGKAALSGYQNQIYKKLEQYGWRRIDIQTKCNMGKIGDGKSERTESLWLNYEPYLL